MKCPNCGAENKSSVLDTTPDYRGIRRRRICKVCEHRFSTFEEHASISSGLVAEVEAFRDERDWMIYHTPANLAASISIEAAELLELFQWGRVPDTPDLADELADVLIYALSMASVCGLDVSTIIRRKMEKNAVKYPA